MSARTVARRTLRSAAATAVVAAVAGTVLMPLSASATESGPKGLKITMGAPAPSGPLTRGGAVETFELSVSNPSDKAAPFHPWMLGNPTGASPLQKSDVVFKVEAVKAPATESAIGQQDGEWQGLFFPVGKKVSDGFEIPAGAEMTWKVTIGFGKSYPTTNGDFRLVASSFENELPAGEQPSLTFKTDKPVKAGTLETKFKNVNACKGIDPLRCREMDLSYRLTGDGEFNTALVTRLSALFAPATDKSGLQVEALVGGTWKELATDGGFDFTLPQIEKGFSAASGERVVHLRAKLGPKTEVKKETAVELTAYVFLAEGNDSPFTTAKTEFRLAPSTPDTKPTTPAPTSAAPTTPASAAPATAVPASSAPATAGNAPAATGSLAHTGSDSRTGLYSGLAAVLIGLGGAAAWLGARRRGGVTRG